MSNNPDQLENQQSQEQENKRPVLFIPIIIVALLLVLGVAGYAIASGVGALRPPTPDLTATQETSQPRETEPATLDETDVAPTIEVIPTDNGRLVISYPKIMIVEETDSIIVTIIPDPDLREFSMNQNSRENPSARMSERGERLEFLYDEILIYPAMRAELIAPSFDIDSVGPIAKTVILGEQEQWAWLVTPKSTGVQNFSIIVDGGTERDEEFELERSFSIGIDPDNPMVIEVKSKPFEETAGTSVARDIVPLVVGLVSVSATVAGIVVGVVSPLVVSWFSKVRGQTTIDDRLQAIETAMVRLPIQVADQVSTSRSASSSRDNSPFQPS